MKVALLCSSAEPGRDGVGDYVRRCAQVLTRHGHPCQIVALSDRFIDQPGVAVDPVDGFQVVRLPSTDWQCGRIEPAVHQLGKFTPDWVSLQMVSYGFEERGMLWRSARRFARLGFAVRRHIMFHELWIGPWTSSSAKDRAVGWVQRRLLLRALQSWNPEMIHTSNATYREMLRRAKVAAAEIAIPGNVPVRQIDATRARSNLEGRLPAAATIGRQLLLGGIFGNLPLELAAGNWLEQLIRSSERSSQELVIVQLGRPGPHGTGVITGLRRQARDRARFLELGELPPADVSVVLQGLDFGIAASPWPLIGKSGAAAAMLEHGVPVVVPREELMLRGGSPTDPTRRPNLYRLQEFCVALESRALRRAEPSPGAWGYEKFMQALECAS